MSWMKSLYQTYENVKDDFAGVLTEQVLLLPLFHSEQNAHVHVVLDDTGNFRAASVISKNEAKAIIPVTEKSAGRAGAVIAPHPLFDKLQYVAGDFIIYGGEEGRNGYDAYIEQLENWCSSTQAHPKVQAVYQYLKHGKLIQDLVVYGVLQKGMDGKLLKKRTDQKQPDAEIFTVLPANNQIKDQLDAFIRFSVETPGDPQSALWTDKSVWKSWIDYSMEHNDSKEGLCLVTGEISSLAVNHPKRLRNGGDGAKLISANDASGFTFRGKFIESDQVCGVGLEVTQKAHNALRWLLARQGLQENGLAVVAWAVSGKPIPDPCASTDWMAEDENTAPVITDMYEGGQAVAKRFKRKLSGFKSELGDTDKVVVLAMDSATPGRMAIKYYRELTGSEYLDRVEQWHTQCAWELIPEKGQKFVGAPSPKLIAQAAYGRRMDEKLGKATIERLLPCIIDGVPIHRDLVGSCVFRACNRGAMDSTEWERTLGVACAVYRYCNKGEYDMSLDRSRRTRSYAYGRLLALADHVEQAALSDAEKMRSTNAARLMQRFAARPYSTWRTIGTDLRPYQDRLAANKPGLLHWLTKEMQEVYDLFAPEDFSDDSPLSGEFLLGFYCQRADLWRKKETSSSQFPDENFASNQS